jgi:hypothetical protein
MEHRNLHWRRCDRVSGLGPWAPRALAVGACACVGASLCARPILFLLSGVLCVECGVRPRRDPCGVSKSLYPCRRLCDGALPYLCRAPRCIMFVSSTLCL